MNKVMLIGHLGKDPEMNEQETVCNFSLATNEGEETEWHKIVLFSKTAEVAMKYLHKGSQIYLEGRIKYASYENSEGVKKYFTEILGSKMQMLDKKPSGSGNANTNNNSTSTKPSANEQSNAQSQAASPAAGGFGPGEDDIPFDIFCDSLD